ncbi:MAG: hypothetical protein ACXWSC_20880, partial [Bdellovibrionota bacterium]
PALQAGGQRFDPVNVHQIKKAAFRQPFLFGRTLTENEKRRRFDKSAKRADLHERDGEKKGTGAE